MCKKKQTNKNKSNNRKHRAIYEFVRMTTKMSATTVPCESTRAKSPCTKPKILLWLWFVANSQHCRDTKGRWIRKKKLNLRRLSGKIGLTVHTDPLADS